ncbi:pseudouridine-metabolizing bifunctional protein [Colletotrichum spaethianum]|uniref:Pseudouridine-metabolizing bifunctional protein n=1 Tax=Colletotrichum spaethianum TaxID=700344 RepID=A0AA37L8G0_9PEZI|nr:pseudouridine-metabolizing bifunctional protein [Colletotrichum spaethianum]GKT42015.1 pseudouridine-metabolizing bifunctional protein [Colletotrichum spaethianum]
MIVPRSSCRLARHAISPAQLCRSSKRAAPAGAVFGRLQADRRYMSAGAYRTPAGLKDLLRVSEEVADAVATNKPVVALESTIYTHGALGNDLGLEDVVRQGGGVPAVCGILNGEPVVGLTEAEVAQMVDSGTASKVSRRDVAHLVGLTNQGITGKKVHGGTTIAGTMLLSRLAGIRIFGTGGLGGVHRGGENTMDVSADLTELGRTRVAVVSAGCKGFLDIPRTLEFLETHGAFVATFADGRTGQVDFPAFWARDSGTKSPLVVQTEREAAAMILAQERLGIESGMLFANPIPEEYAIPRAEMDAVIETAVTEAMEKGFTGAANTPYVLGRIRKLTQERSTLANKALVRSNVARATSIAVELSKLLNGDAGSESVSSNTFVSGYDIAATAKPATKAEAPKSSKADVLVAGSVAVDLSCDYQPLGDKKEVSPHMHTSNPARISQSIGGVGHNVALAAHRVSEDLSVRLCSLIGDDVAGATVLSSLEASGLETTYIRQLTSDCHVSNRTAQYVAVNDAEKNLVMAMADMGIFTNHSFPDYWKSAVAGAKPRWLVVDGKWSPKDIRAWIQAGREQACKVAFEPVSTAKSISLFPREHPHLGVFPNPGIDIASPNHYELTAMYSAAKENGFFDTPEWFEVIDAFGMHGARERFVYLTSREMTDAGIPVQMIHLLPYIPTIVTKLGSKGVLLTTILGKNDPRLKDRNEERWLLTRAHVDHPTIGGVYMRLFPPAETVAVEDIVSVNGVGDTFLGVMIAGLSQGGKVEHLIDVAQKAAVLTLKSHESVSPDLGRLDRLLKAAVKS